MRVWIQRAASLAGDRGLRGEAGWVVASKLVEFSFVFLLLKLLTNALGRGHYGEFNLAEVSIVLLTHLALVPVRESYLRDFHGAEQRGESRESGLYLIRWYGLATLGVAALAGVLTRAFAQWFDIGPWTALAAGLVFLFDRWRFLAQDVLNVQRRRRRWAIGNVGFGLAKLTAIFAAVSLFPPTASTALFGYAGASALFAALIAGPMLADILRSPAGSPSRLSAMALSFGMPFAFLLAFQWTQVFADRFLVKGLLDPADVGVYVAAFQVCGAPYTLLLQVLNSLLTPIAYQRGWDETDASRLWAADRVLVGGVGVQLAAGLVLLAGYLVWGSELVVLLTSEAFAVPTALVAILATGRFLQTLAQSLQPIFAVHHKMGSILWLRLVGAALTVGLCWPLTLEYGILGAAAGSCAAFALYLGILLFAPSGCFWLVLRARRGALAGEQV